MTNRNGRAIQTYRSEGRTATNVACPASCRRRMTQLVRCKVIMSSEAVPIG